MYSKKLWQTCLILFSFLFLSALAVWICSRLGAGASWKPFFGVGAGLMLAALVPLGFHERNPRLPLLTLALNVLSCGFLIGSYFIGARRGLSLSVAVYSVLASTGSYLFFMLLLSVPVLNRRRAYIVVVFLLWAAGLFTAGGILWRRCGGENGALFTLLSIVVALFAFASLADVSSFDELILALALPSSCAAGIVAVVVLLLLTQADDCDCGCDCGGGDCCDCSPDYDGISTKKKTSMSSMGDGDGVSGRLRSGCKR